MCTTWELIPNSSEALDYLFDGDGIGYGYAGYGDIEEYPFYGPETRRGLMVDTRLLL